MRVKSLILPLLFASALMFAVEGLSSSTNAVSASFLGKRVSVESGGGDYAGKIGASSRKRNEARLKAYLSHSRDDVFLSIRGDVLTWGEIDDYVDLLLKVSPISLPPQATVDQIEKITQNSRRKLAEGAGNQYLQSCLLRSLELEAGISVREEDVLRAVSNSVRKVRGKFRAEVLAASLRKDGYLYRKQVGYLMTKKYLETVVKAGIEVTEEEVRAAQEERHREISDAVAYNATLRPRIDLFRSEILAGKRDFVETVDKYSDCDSSLDDGILGEYTRANCPLHKNLRAFIFSASTNEYSEIIETPYSYHLVRVLSRRFGPCDEDEDDDEMEDEDSPREEEPEVEGAPTKVKVAHLMLEKREVDEELDEATARVLVLARKTKVRMADLQREFYKTVQSEPGFVCDFRVNFMKQKKKGKK